MDLKPAFNDFLQPRVLQPLQRRSGRIGAPGHPDALPGGTSCRRRWADVTQIKFTKLNRFLNFRQVK